MLNMRLDLLVYSLPFDVCICFSPSQMKYKHIQVCNCQCKIPHLQLSSLYYSLVPEAFKSQLQVPFFMEIIILLCQSIWTTRNNLILQNLTPIVAHCKETFMAEVCHDDPASKQETLPSDRIMAKCFYVIFLLCFLSCPLSLIL